MQLDFANIPQFEPKNVDLPDAPFLHYKPEFPKLKALWKEFGHFHNLIIIGNGGSVTSAMGIFFTLATANGQNERVKFLSTVDPDYIAKLRKQFNSAETLVIAISKSGETVTQIESLMHFTDYPTMVITQKGSTLEQIGKKLNSRIVAHPPIGGRFTAFTEVALAPAAIAGVDVEGLFAGAQEIFAKYKEENSAMRAAQIFYHLEQQGIVDVFMPFYSHELFAFNNLIVQLCHESFGKDGKGQTYFAHEAPESQHHTNQRFFGGRKNIGGFFVALEHFTHDALTEVPPALQSIPLKDSSLFELNKIPLSYAMHAEFKGTWEDAQIHAIPIVALKVSQIDAKEIGRFIAFWQLYAVYSATLREVNPFDQPQVENSKLISWNKRKDFHRS